MNFGMNILISVFSILVAIGLISSIIETCINLFKRISKHWLGCLEFGILILSIFLGWDWFMLVLTAILGLNLVLKIRRQYQKAKLMLMLHRKKKEE